MKSGSRRSPREPVFEVVWPLARYAGGPTTRLSPPVSDLNGKTIAELSNWRFKAGEMFGIIREALQQRYSDIKFVDHKMFGDIHGPNENEVVAALPGLLRQHGVDAVITGVAS